MKNLNKILILTSLLSLVSCIDDSNNNSSTTSESSINQHSNNSYENSSLSQILSSSNSGESSLSSSILSSKESNGNSNNSSYYQSTITSNSSTLIIDENVKNYYSSINLNATGDNLVKSLGKLITSTHKQKSYDDLWDGYILGDIRPGTNYLWDMYSNCNYDAYNPPRKNYSKEGDAVNREHSVPQSWFNEASPMKSDYYHVVPTDGYVNNRRSNYPFGEVDNNSIRYQSQNGSKLGNSSVNGISGIVFEPIDEYKGDFARIYFYMCTRYYTKVGSWSGGVFKSSYPYINNNYLNLYLKWAKQDPVSDKERMRNKGGYIFQGNRNPYVDYPALLYQAFDSTYEFVEQTDEEKANEIIELINKIGNVTLDSKNAIQQARSAYNNSTENVKSLVTNYNTLLKAEEDYNLLLEQSGSDINTESINCTFNDKSFSNDKNINFKSSVSPLGFENERGIQFNNENDLIISTNSISVNISKVTIIASSNQNTYTFDVSVNNSLLSSTNKTIKSKDRNVSLEFVGSNSLKGELSIHITAPSKNKSLWIKSIIIN